MCMVYHTGILGAAEEFLHKIYTFLAEILLWEQKAGASTYTDA